MARSANAVARTRRARPGDLSIIAGVELSHPDKVLFAEQGLTKRDLADYYVAVAERMLPHVSGRPLTLLRCPSGQGGKCFVQQHAGAGMPKAVRRVVLSEKRREATHLVVDDLKGLVSLVQVGVLEIHAWGARADDPDRPDRLIFDLDPDRDLPFAQVKEAATEARDRLRELGLESFAKTTGGKGLHVVVPLARRHGWAETKAFAEQLAKGMAQDRPNLYVTKMAKEARRGKIFIDYLRNDRGATAIVPYSTRARATAPVAMPLRWEELPGLAAANQVTVDGLRRRSMSSRDDPWGAMSGLRQSLTQQAFRRLGIAT